MFFNLRVSWKSKYFIWRDAREGYVENGLRKLFHVVGECDADASLIQITEDSEQQPPPGFQLVMDV